MDGFVTGIFNDANIASEVVQKLSAAGYDTSKVSVATKDNPVQGGYFQGTSIVDLPQKMMSYAVPENTANNYYEEIYDEDYVFIAVSVYQNDVDIVKKIFSDYGGKDIQFNAK